MQRIVIIGNAGSGKSTLAKKLADKLGFSYIDLDEFFHLPGWQERPLDEFRALVYKATMSDKWVLSGNYFTKTRDISWSRSDTLIWLDMPFLPNFFELLNRTLRRVFTSETSCNGNKEVFAKSFFSRNSLLWVFVRKWRPTNERFAGVFSNPGEYNHLRLIRLKSYRESQDFVNRISP